MSSSGLPRVCSTPEGVFVGFTTWIGLRSLVGDGSAQRPRASSSGSRGPGADRRRGRRDLLNARGRLRRVHGHYPKSLVASEGCSTPEGVFVGFTTSIGEPKSVAYWLLNARGRLRRVHDAVIVLLMGENNCSTPEGVFVGFTPARPRSCTTWTLLNARGRLRRVHPPRPGPRRLPAGSAQRPRASSSGSQPPPQWSLRCPSSAQRPRASSSGSRLGPGHRVHLVILLNARGRLRRVHVGDQRARSGREELLNARGRLRRVHRRGGCGPPRARGCSTPEGVFVGFTSFRASRRASGLSAQRPRASSSGSRGPGRGRGRRGRLLNARGRLRRVHAGRRPRRRGSCTAQRPRASSSGSRPEPLRFGPLRQLLNARGRLRRVHVIGALPSVIQ